MSEIPAVEGLADSDTVAWSKDAYYLQRFDALSAAQVPASTAWTPVTDYSFDARKAIEGPHPQLIKDVLQPAFVIDAGCGRDGILVKLLRALDVPVMGFDPSVPTRSIDPALLHGSLTECRFGGDHDQPFADVVICREVLEHLTIRQIRDAVRNLVHLTTRYVYVTTRFHPNPQHLLDVATSDDLDPTHITMLNQDFLRTLFVLEGCHRRADLEQQMDHQSKGRVLVYERPCAG